MAALLKLKDQGMIRAIGVSNVSVNEIKEHTASGEVASDQFRSSMLLRDAEIGILPYCHEHNIAGLTYISLEQGLPTGKIRMERTFGKNEIRSNADWNGWFIP